MSEANLIHADRRLGELSQETVNDHYYERPTIQRAPSNESNSVTGQPIQRQNSFGSQRSNSVPQDSLRGTPNQPQVHQPNQIPQQIPQQNAFVSQPVHSTLRPPPQNFVSSPQPQQVFYPGQTHITASRLRTGNYGTLLNKYPTLDPHVHPVVGETQIIETGPQKSRVIQSQQKIDLEELKGTSKIEFKPFQKKVIEYKEERRIERVPKTRKIVDYREKVVTDVIPREVVKKDYYAVEYLKEYVPEYIPERTVQMVQKAVPFKRIEYVPVTRQVYHGAPIGNLNANLENLPLASEYLVGGTHGVSNSASFAGVQPFYQNYTGEFFNNGQHIPTYPQNLQHLGSTNAGQWQNTIPGYGLGGVSTTTVRQQNNRRLNTVYDSYESYVPSFKY